MNTDITPVLGPLLALLRSRAVLVALFRLILLAVEEYVPALKQFDAELTQLSLAIIAKLAVEDAAKKYGEAKAGNGNG